MTKRSRPCGHWRGRESALRRPRCYCRLGGAKSRTNRPTTHRVEPPSRVASLNCLASTWNFHVGATEISPWPFSLQSKLSLEKKITDIHGENVTQCNKVGHSFLSSKASAIKRQQNSIWDKMKLQSCLQNLGAPHVIILVMEAVILNASFSERVVARLY